MADLQEELQRFLTARFGVDVKDAFVSCIQKIHKENQDVAALEQPMKDATQQVLDIREEVVTASQNAVQTADDAKTIARAAESSSSEALATAKNAKDESFNASGDAQLAMSAAQNMQQSFSNMELLLSGKVDGAFVENGYLYLTSNNEVVAGPLGPFSGTGGSGGSGGNNAVLAVSNTSGWLSKSIAYGKDCLIQITWSSLEDEMPTGNGVMKVTVNGIVKAMLDIPQGAVTADLGPYLSVGSNAVRIQVSDAYENSRTINFNINAIEASMSSTFDSGTAFDGIITFTYVPVGAISKTVHILLDGKEIATVTTTSSGRQMSYTIPAQKHGAHTLEAYFDATVNGQTIESNHLYYEIICVESLNTTPIIATSFQDGTVAQYTTLVIPFTVYDPANLTAEIELSVNGNVVSRQTVDRTQQIWSYRADSAGNLALEIFCGSASRTIAVTVTASEMEIEAETEGLSLYLSSAGRSNTEENPGVWEYGDISAVFSGFNFTSDGWQLDEDNIPVLRVSGDARLTIPVQPFAKDFRTTGKTIEIEFATRDVMNYDAVVLSCMSGNRGISVTPQLATLRSEQKEISTRYKENEHLRLSFVVEKKAANRLIYCYINGIMSGVVQYPADDDFAQSAPVDISIGSRDAAIDLYCIRIYDNDLTRHQVLNNWIADTQVVETMLERYSRNHVFDAYSQIVISQLPKDLPYLVLDGTELPQYKGDVKTMSGYYTDPVNGSKSFTFSGAEVDVQGTSSQYYARKNYKIKFKGGFVDASGNTQETYKLRSDSIPTNTFTFKADVASSEGANNVELARLYDETCPFQTAPQKQDSRIRQGIDGFPIVVFWYDGENTSFIGKYNFNFDKATPEVFGFAEGDESWEILNNTSDRVLWKDDDYTGTDWQGDFEARYPKDYADPANLAELAAWLKSTDQSAATGDKLKVNRTFDGVLYTTDTADYRLAKFKSEFAQHFEKDAVLFYYLFTELFLMVDSRAKNMFPTFMAGSKWFSLPYDFDTAIGINNEGALVFSYNLEDIDHTESGADIYNGQQSVLWINVRAAFYEDIKAMYQKLRSGGTLSFAVTEQRFEEHQAKWPEAVFNEDAYFKYLQPLVEQNTASYLTMLQGSKAEQRKWWLYNRFRYLDSKYNAGDALTDVVTLRGYAKDDIILTFYDLLDTMRGLDENGNNTEKAQISGTFTIAELTNDELTEVRERYPNIRIQYEHTHSNVYFYADSGNTLLKTVTVYDGEDAAYSGSNPTKASTAQYSYSFSGWSLTAGGAANANALKAVASDRNVYAAFTSTVRKYTVRFYNGTTLAQTVSEVPYGSNASYTGDTPAKTDVEKPEDYEFTGWNPSPNGITGNTDCYAQYRFIGYISVGIVERSISGDYSNDRVTTVGAYAFQNCSGLTSVSFPNVTSIGDYAFNAAHKLAKADLPKVTSIGQHGFSAANALEALILRNTEKVCSLGSDAVSYTKISSGSGYIYVPAALVDSYKAAANWQNYADQIRAIEDYPEITGGES